MIVTALIFIYMLFTGFITGFCFIRLVTGKEPYHCAHFESYIIAGIGVLTVFAQAWSIFGGVALWANIVLIIACIIICIIQRKDIPRYLTGLLRKKSIIDICIVLVLFLLFAYGASHGYMHYDSDLYHAQSIRWIEEYGLVKGLGNLHTRLGYNSSAFCLTALFSMSFLGRQSFHATAGFLAFILALLCRDMFRKENFLKPCLSNFLRLVAIYYLLIIYDEMVSPASDYFMVILALFVLILFAEGVEKKEEDFRPFALLMLLSLVIVSVKISGAMIVLLSIYPAYLLLKGKDIKNIIKYLLLGLASVLPYFVRNIILTGYLVYPVTAIDIFNFDFKIPLSVAEYDSREIQVYGRGYSDISRFDEALSEWVPDWFRGLDFVNKLSFILAIIGIFVFLLLLVYFLIKRRYDTLPSLLIVGVCGISFLFWFLTSPNIRYGCVFLWTFPVLSHGYLYINVFDKLGKKVFYKGLVCIFLVYKLFAFGREFINLFDSSYLFRQQDYGEYELLEFTLKGNTFYEPVYGDQTGYSHFPSVPYIPNADLVSENIRDGFIPLIQNNK